MDYLIKGGIVIDGSGSAIIPEKMDIAIKDDRIEEIGTLPHVKAGSTINAEGLFVCPGFIDAHAHSEFALLADGRAEGKISQGITTEVNGNCGLSAAPLYGPAREQREADLAELEIKERWHTFDEYFGLLKRKGIATNFVTLAGHGNIRASIVGYADRQPTESEMEQMAALLRSTMQAGAKGISTGLIYPPGIYAETPELITLSSEAARHNGIYTTHMRSEGDMVTESVREAITIAEEAAVPVHISHLKTSGAQNWGKIHDVFALIEEALGRGLMISCDRYPYTASSTDLDTVLPSWAYEGGRKREIARLKEEREGLEREVLRAYNGPDCWDKIVISSVVSDKNRWMEGKSILELSRIQGKREVDSVFDLLIDEALSVGAIFFTMNDENLNSILRKPYSVMGTDSAARSFDGITARGVPHPRGFGSCPRLLGRFVRDQGVLTLSEAVYKMTGLTAQIFGIKKRGMLAKGFRADIVVFDGSKVIDTADFRTPFMKPEGIRHVFVNGKPALRDGEPTGALAGRILA